ncbi:uncharacterized protein LOC124141736 [Haliotis rufescens]|uniref:uncharacterized protein LOC124141736 n=1 Tax=Haliotis rufescens TaxID=6454 RepID=UPI001EAFF118|nr:uncharacterized protein LOC124141736 [Haliotis rufescens]
MELYVVLSIVALAAIQGVAGSGDCLTDAYCTSGQCCFRGGWRSSTGVCLLRQLFTQYCNSPPKPCTSQAQCGAHECCKETSPGSVAGVCAPHGLEKSNCSLTSNPNNPLVAMCSCEMGFTCKLRPDTPNSNEGTCVSPLTHGCRSHSDCPKKKCCTTFGDHSVCTTPSGTYGRCPT